MKKYFKIMVFSLVIISFLVVSLNSTAQAKSNDMQYNNKVFTKKVYKKTVMIDFNGKKIKDKKTIKKVYKLLANMTLKPKKPDGVVIYGFVYLILHMKNGNKREFYFVDGQMSASSQKYTIVEKDPLNKITKIIEEKS